jgi:transcriptional antiterminator NusG
MDREEQNNLDQSSQATEEVSQNTETSVAPAQAETTPAGASAKHPDMKWYIIHTYSGYENKAKLGLLERVQASGKQELFGEILIPTENVVEMVQGKKKTMEKKFFPGYVFVEMVLNDDTWHIVKATPRVTGFVGKGKNPPAVPEAEVRRLTNRIEEGTLAPKLKMSFDKGESVRVIEGPFQNFNGLVDDVNPDKGKLRVLVSIFGRSTPVELDFSQVEKN